MDNNIVLLILPSHTSHLTQPLDVGIFGPLKSAMSFQLNTIFRTGIDHLQKLEWWRILSEYEGKQSVMDPGQVEAGFDLEIEPTDLPSKTGRYWKSDIEFGLKA